MKTLKTTTLLKTCPISLPTRVIHSLLIDSDFSHKDIKCNKSHQFFILFFSLSNWFRPKCEEPCESVENLAHFSVTKTKNNTEIMATAHLLNLKKKTHCCMSWRIVLHMVCLKSVFQIFQMKQSKQIWFSVIGFNLIGSYQIISFMAKKHK